MSSTTSSDRLTLLSYATLNYHIPIHNHSGSTWRQHQWKHRDNDSFSNKPYKVPRSSFRKAIWKTNAWYLLCLELTFAHEALVLIPKHLGDITDFFRDISFENEI